MISEKLSKYSMGTTAAILTSMGLIAGLAGDNSLKTTIIASLLIFAVADNISDSLGIHIYKESQGAQPREIMSSTYGNFTARFILILSFVLIVLIFPSTLALIVASLWGLSLLVLLSLAISRSKKVKPIKQIAWHLLVAVAVIIGSRLIGNFITGLVLR